MKFIDENFSFIQEDIERDNSHISSLSIYGKSKFPKISYANLAELFETQTILYDLNLNKIEKAFESYFSKINSNIMGEFSGLSLEALPKEINHVINPVEYYNFTPRNINLGFSEDSFYLEDQNQSYGDILNNLKNTHYNYDNELISIRKKQVEIIKQIEESEFKINEPIGIIRENLNSASEFANASTTIIDQANNIVGKKFDNKKMIDNGKEVMVEKSKGYFVREALLEPSDTRFKKEHLQMLFPNISDEQMSRLYKSIEKIKGLSDGLSKICNIYRNLKAFEKGYSENYHPVNSNSKILKNLNNDLNNLMRLEEIELLKKGLGETAGNIIQNIYKFKDIKIINKTLENITNSFKSYAENLENSFNSMGKNEIVYGAAAALLTQINLVSDIAQSPILAISEELGSVMGNVATNIDRAVSYANLKTIKRSDIAIANDLFELLDRNHEINDFNKLFDELGKKIQDFKDREGRTLLNKAMDINVSPLIIKKIVEASSDHVVKKNDTSIVEISSPNIPRIMTNNETQK